MQSALASHLFTQRKRFRRDVWKTKRLFLLTRKTELIKLSLLGISQAVVQVLLASVYIISFLVILFLHYMLLSNSSLGLKS